VFDPILFTVFRYALGCYNPWNYQSRALQSWSEEPHSVVGTPCNIDFEPSFDQAILEMLRMDWVGLQDFFHESVCLLVHRVGGSSHSYMQSCGCDGLGNPLSSAYAADFHEDHSGGHAIRSHVDVDELTLAKIDSLTVTDRFEASLV